MKKSVLFTVLLLAFLMLAESCGGTPAETAGTTAADTKPSGDVPASSESRTESVTDPEPVFFSVASGGKTEYKIVTREKFDPDVTSATNFAAVFANRTGASPELVTDSAAAAEKEILIGSTSRPESKEFISSLPDNGYGYRVSGNRIVIAGKRDSLNALALYAFAEAAFEGNYISDGVFSLPEDLAFTADAGEDYSTPYGVLINGKTVVADVSNPRNTTSRNGFTVGQGATTDGKNFYTALLKKSTDTDEITRFPIDKNAPDAQPVAKAVDLPLSHANDMCFSLRDNAVIVDKMAGTELAYLDPETLEIKKTVSVTTVDGAIWAVAYLNSREEFVLRAGTSLYITDADFNLKKSAQYNSTQGYTGQGMDCDDRLIYIPQSKGDNTNDNIIEIYDWDLNLIRVVHLPISTECETIMNWAGKYYMHFNVRNSSVYDLDFVEIFDPELP
ncbi:MAG: hypothetical protein J6V01_07110 [Clostridia bacterium]|nr:hypothetical protein [Clostridia bacterium]